MNICILTVDNKNSESEISKLEPFANPLLWLKKHNVQQYSLSKINYRKTLSILLKNKFDVYINLCDGAKGEDRPGIEVVKYLEKNHTAFTGANSNFYEPSRLEMKKACEKAKLPFAKGIIIKNEKDLTKVNNNLNFPLIVKHFNSYNSVGLTKKSIVNNYDDLLFQSKIIISKYKAALVEEYIEGREFTALVTENPKNKKKSFVFEPMEIIFPKGETFKHFDLKWKKHSSMKYLPVSNKLTNNKIKEYSSKMFAKMDGSGYARCDLRMNSKGELFMLEINPNCSIYFPKINPSSADEILYNHNNGHEIFTDLILKSALLKNRNIKVNI